MRVFGGCLRSASDEKDGGGEAMRQELEEEEGMGEDSR